MKRILLLAAIFFIASDLSFAQRARIKEGSLDALRGIKTLNVKYDYSNMEVGKKSEKEFIADKKESYNRKEPGRGDKWERDWVADREARFEPRFEEAFNKYCSIQIGHNPKEKYTMIFKTVYTEPGYNIAISRKNAYIDGEVWIIETNNPGKIIAKLEINDCPGRTFMGNDYDTGERIQEAYAMAGKGLARFFSKYTE